MILKAQYISKIYSGRKVVKNISLEVKQGEIIGLLQSPASNAISALQSGGGKIAGILNTLSEKE